MDSYKWYRIFFTVGLISTKLQKSSDSQRPTHADRNDTSAHYMTATRTSESDSHSYEALGNRPTSDSAYVEVTVDGPTFNWLSFADQQQTDYRYAFYQEPLIA